MFADMEHTSTYLYCLCVWLVTTVCVQVGECTTVSWCVAVACHCPFQETGRVHLCTHVKAFTFASPLHTWQELLVPAHLALCALSWCREGKRRVSECGWVYTARV